MFGTDTKVAVDISGDPTGQPSFTVGYKRREAIWLPLSSGMWGAPTHLCVKVDNKMTCEAVSEDRTRGSHVCVAMADANKANAFTKDNQPLLCDSSANVRGHLYQGAADGNKGSDSYSVMASFGLDSSPSGGAKIAQFIATGIAARNLTQSNGAALVNSQAAVPEIAVQQAVQIQQSRLDKIAKAVVVNDKVDAAKLDSLLAKSKLADGAKKKLKGYGGKSGKEFTDVLSSEFASNLEELAGIAEGGL
ncbi:MAG: hypothetical protein HXY26_06200 [Hydrogenophilaceae bacterium]|nr:hypothetical protein [Hydrogenophilaceae bacterium]